jgi:hypothetical protein
MVSLAQHVAAVDAFLCCLICIPATLFAGRASQNVMYVDTNAACCCTAAVGCALLYHKNATPVHTCSALNALAYNASTCLAGRASQNVMYVEALHEVPAMMATVAAASNCLVMVERFLSGEEYCIAVMGAGSAGAVAFSAVERQLEEDEKVRQSLCAVITRCGFYGVGCYNGAAVGVAHKLIAVLFQAA